MINSNPETVSTDFNVSDKLYFEPLTLEDVPRGGGARAPDIGVIVQLGGQTPLKLTQGLEAAGVTILGTSPDAINAAEDRRRFEAIARRLKLRQPDSGTATSPEEAQAIATRVGYPVLLRPSYVLGARCRWSTMTRPSTSISCARRQLGGAACPDRQISGGRIRGRRRRGGRCARRGDRRRDAAHRGCGDPLR